MEKDLIKKYVPLLLVAVILIASYFIIKPYITLLLISAVMAFTFYPLYKLTKKVLRNEIISALFVSFLTILIIFITVGFVIIGVYSQALSTYSEVRETLYGNDGYLNCEAEINYCDTFEKISGTINDENINRYLNLQKKSNEISNFIVAKITNFFTNIPKSLINFTIIIFMMYYFFKDGQRLIEYISEKLNLKKRDEDMLLSRIKDAANSIIFGSIIIALIQGLFGALGYWIIGINSPLLWGLAIAFFSLIPVFGTAIIWIPQSAYLIITGLDDGTWVKGAILLTYCFFVVGGVDNILRPVMLGTKAKIHPVIILIGVLGGIPVFGLMGIILGPLLLGIAVTIFEYTTQKNG
jgi:predicted PurR-regulated permease PerM